MPRWVFAAAILTASVALPVVPAQGGWFSHDGSCSDDCCPSCAAPVDCYTPPTCCAPQQYAPAAPTCCAPAAPVCCAPTAPVAPSCGCPDYCHGDACCDSGYSSCKRESCLSRCFRRLMDLEHRKNRCLKRTFLGWRDKDHCHGGDCAPQYYYQPSCATPGACY